MTRIELMAAQYSHKQFFRRMPNTQLAKYFKSKDIDLGLDFTKLKEKDSEQVFCAFLQLPENERDTIETDFQNIKSALYLKNLRRGVKI